MQKYSMALFLQYINIIIKNTRTILFPFSWPLINFQHFQFLSQQILEKLLYQLQKGKRGRSRASFGHSSPSPPNPRCPQRRPVNLTFALVDTVVVVAPESSSCSLSAANFSRRMNPTTRTYIHTHTETLSRGA